MPRSFSRDLPRLFTAQVFFLLALAAVVAISVVSYQSLSAPVEAARRVDRSIRLQGELKAVMEGLYLAISGHRGYLLTGLGEYLEPYESGRRAVEEHLKEIEALTTDNPRHQERLKVLRPLMEQRLNDLATTLQLYDDGARMEAVLRVRANIGKQSGEVLEEMLAEEARVLDAREEAHSVSVRRSFAVTQAGSAVLFLLLAVTAWVARREQRTRQLVQRELEAQLGELRSIATGEGQRR